MRGTVSKFPTILHIGTIVLGRCKDDSKIAHSGLLSGPKMGGASTVQNGGYSAVRAAGGRYGACPGVALPARYATRGLLRCNGKPEIAGMYPLRS